MKKLSIKPGYLNIPETNFNKIIQGIIKDSGLPVANDCCGTSSVFIVGQTLTWNGTKWVATSSITPVSKGTSVLVAGTKVVANTNVTANSNIQLTNNIPGGTVGALYVSSRVPGVSFTITSTSNLDTSTIGYLIYN